MAYIKNIQLGIPAKNYEKVLKEYERFNFDNIYLLKALKKSGIKNIESLP